MCRFTLYLGPPIRLSSLITEPVHSLIHQSHRSEQRSEPVNGDGFGLAWYAPSFREEPALFRSIAPAWNNPNLIDIARVVESRCLLAHVRAASPGLGVSMDNCHPFRSGRLAFMHNGAVGGFRRLRRPILETLSEEAFEGISGSTDSEHVFALFQDRLREEEGGDPAESMATALRNTLGQVAELMRERTDEVSMLNLAVSDGTSAVVSRWTTGDPDDAPSLYFNRGRRYTCSGGACRMLDAEETRGAVIVSSEPLSREPSWEEVPPNHLVLIPENRKTRFVDLGS